MTAARLRAVLARFEGPVGALRAIGSGCLEDEVCETSAATRRMWQAHAAAGTARRRIDERGTQVWIEGAADYPIVDAVPDLAPVLLGEGRRPEAFEAPRVAIVGTRAATPHGLADARELGGFLAAEQITVVSGLAIGIDGAAHEGALDAGGLVVGVVATGLDITYPRRHTVLYERVRANGVIVSEQAFGVGPRPGLFPVRNRIIAALADVVVVVEATMRGGARITAQYALEYGRPVLAVPGSRRNPSAAGTNALIADGAHPLVDWSDVVLAMGMTPARTRSTPDRRATPSAGGRALLDALGGESANPDQLASRTGRTPEQIAIVIVELERAGWIERAQGAVWPR